MLRRAGAKRRVIVALLLATVAWYTLYGGSTSPSVDDEFDLESGYATRIRYAWTKSFVVAADVHEGTSIATINRSGDEVVHDRTGFRESADTVSDGFVSRLMNAIADAPMRKRRTIVYVTTEALAYFIQRVLPKVTQNYPHPSPLQELVLITGCTDPGPALALRRVPGPDAATHPATAEELLSSPHIHAWWAQNCDVLHPKMRCVPIGLDYHSQAMKKMWWGSRISPYDQDESLSHFAHAAVPWASRKVKVYMDFNSHSNRAVRGALYLQFFSKPFVDYSIRSDSRDALWAKYAQYAFVLSPPGNGYDCHRTWEALVLGAVPIVLASQTFHGSTVADELFADLPVVVVRSYDEVTAEALKRWHKEIDEKQRRSAFVGMAKLTNQYWLSRFVGSATENLS